MDPVTVRPGSSPVLLCFPHVGTEVPARICEALNERGRKLTDTDWHIDRLYEGLLPEATTVSANFHRYVIDANRDPGGSNLYPGQNTTGLISRTDFEGEPIWRAGHEPDIRDTERRILEFHAPYHEALRQQINRLQRQHEIAVVYDCHSIRSRLPFLFSGVLPDFNIGTSDGKSCDPLIERAAREVAGAASGFSHILNGRFKGGWTTRYYGRPKQGVHAIQMELAQSTYLMTEKPPFEYCEKRADTMRVYLKTLLKRIAETALRLPGKAVLQS